MKTIQTSIQTVEIIADIRVSDSEYSFPLRPNRADEFDITFKSVVFCGWEYCYQERLDIDTFKEDTGFSLSDLWDAVIEAYNMGAEEEPPAVDDYYLAVA